MKQEASREQKAERIRWHRIKVKRLRDKKRADDFREENFRKIAVKCKRLNITVEEYQERQYQRLHDKND